MYKYIYIYIYIYICMYIYVYTYICLYGFCDDFYVLVRLVSSCLFLLACMFINQRCARLRVVPFSCVVANAKTRGFQGVT